MTYVVAFFTNPYLMAGLSSWLLAQILKLLIHTVTNRSFDIRRLFGDGGMPSGHSAMVTGVATMSALCYGLSSFQFGLAAVLAIIVCHDATGVRRETGKQALLLTEIAKSFGDLTSKELPEVKLKKFVGHTPVQVFAGMLLGLLNALLLYFLVFQSLV